ncbi:SGNH/GDSL hydrolase family protein [Streptomyces litchfieldiae]|uniref:GDSL-type esterase/lipase family protein n=1 Tax=Streptomyces litchfieldiae TaxID=3075543 RepID=A0ABU2MUJ2_9ACTN|nr:GDSL-type esterase/lipase family protein [Streptomyces sp. DSM 44938]MDT0345136.1 GDSL-type esterase/lipase family protein [Streptomyces sp. DSM 44938]
MTRIFRRVLGALAVLGTVLAVLLAGGAPGAAAAPATSAAVLAGEPGDPNIQFTGRWDTSNPQAYTPYWAGAYLSVGFTGTTVKLRQRNTIDLFASIDGGPMVAFTGVSGEVNLTPRRLSAGNHTLVVTYRVVAGSYRGDAVFQGLTLDAGAGTYRLPEREHLIEFVGDSITVGTTTSRNHLTAYPWLIGEQLGADHTAIAQGGACLVAADCVGLEQQFTKLNPNAPTPDWDFGRYQADAVVINLGTNDVGHGVSGAQFQASYTNLLRTVRAEYPNAWIFALETFRGRYVPETEAAVRTVSGEGDSRVSFVDTTGWLGSGDLTDAVHPNDQGHRTITARLAPIIDARL